MPELSVLIDSQARISKRNDGPALPDESGHGYNVLLAGDGRSAVELFKELGHQISVVVLDLTMPSMSGEETFRQLRTSQSFSAQMVRRLTKWTSFNW